MDSEIEWAKLRPILKENFSFTKIKDMVGSAGLPVSRLAQFQQKSSGGASKGQLMDAIDVLFNGLPVEKRDQFVEKCKLQIQVRKHDSAVSVEQEEEVQTTLPSQDAEAQDVSTDREPTPTGKVVSSDRKLWRRSLRIGIYVGLIIAFVSLARLFLSFFSEGAVKAGRDAIIAGRDVNIEIVRPPGATKEGESEEKLKEGFLRHDSPSSMFKALDGIPLVQRQDLIRDYYIGRKIRWELQLGGLQQGRNNEGKRTFTLLLDEENFPSIFGGSLVTVHYGHDDASLIDQLKIGDKVRVTGTITQVLGRDVYVRGEKIELLEK